jgi:hypothetical protein
VISTRPGTEGAGLGKWDFNGACCAAPSHTVFRDWRLASLPLSRAVCALGDRGRKALDWTLSSQIYLTLQAQSRAGTLLQLISSLCRSEVRKPCLQQLQASAKTKDCSSWQQPGSVDLPILVKVEALKLGMVCARSSGSG